MKKTENSAGIIHRYIDRLPLDGQHPIISLGEGDTPLIHLKRFSQNVGKDISVYAKFEGLNPTGSFKDRGMTVAVTEAVTRGVQSVICASTGNTSASAAAYAARAGIKCYVLIPEGKIARGKLAQAVMHGATIIQIQGNFDDGMQLVKQIGEAMPICIVNSINPFRIQGQKTASFEIYETLNGVPDFHYLPVGNAGNITAHWIGYSEIMPNTDTLSSKRPVMVGCQAEGAAPFVHGAFFDQPETVATAIRIGHPQSWDAAKRVIQDSKGWFLSCSDAEILSAQQRLAKEEGVFCEPASAASLAGLLKDIKNKRIPVGSCIVITLTGHGLKDSDVVTENVKANIVNVAPRYADIIKCFETSS